MRYRFGGGIADWTFRAATAGGVDGLAQLVGGQQVTFWTDREGGSQHTNLLDSDSNPATSVTSLDGGGVAGQIPLLWGPDGVQAMWAQAGTGPRALMVTWDAREHTHDASAITSGPLDPARLPEGYGGGGAALGEVWVAAEDAPPEYAGADYPCDGTADDVQIQAALDDAATTGRAVRLSPGRYTLASPIVLNAYRDDACQILAGSGMADTVLDATTPGLPAAIIVSGSASPVIQDLTVEVGEDTDGIRGVVGDGTSSSVDGGMFARLRITGSGADDTNWAIDLDSALTATIDSVEISGTGQGVRLRTSPDGWDSFNVALRNVYVWAAGTSGRALSLETNGQPLHTVNVTSCYLDGLSLAEAIYMGGTHPVTGVTVQSTFAGARTAVNITNGRGNRVDLSEIVTGGGAGRTAVVFGANASGNQVSAGYWRTTSSATLVSDANTTVVSPNVVGPMRVVAEAGVTVGLTRNPSGTTVLRGIGADGAGITTAVQRSETVDAPHHVISLASATTHTIDCRRGSHFRLTATGNFTLANPVNAVDGQRLVLDIKQDGTGSRVMTLGSQFRLNTTFANATLTTAANKTDKLTWQYHATDSKWDLISFVKGI